MGPSQDQTRDPWICSGTNYRLRYGAKGGWTDEQTQMDRFSCRQADKHGQTNKWMDGWIDRWMDRQADTDG